MTSPARTAAQPVAWRSRPPGVDARAESDRALYARIFREAAPFRWQILAVLALSLLAGASGYATYNDIGGHWMEDAHEALANLLLGLVLVHIAGVLVSCVLHRENLVRSMLTGYKLAKHAHPRGRR